MLNIQRIEKQDLRLGYVEVHHIFKTIQGEGPYVGTPAIFIRLAGCNLQCPHCDTDYTSQRKRMTPSEVFDEVSRLAGNVIKLVVVSGGEPLRQNIVPMCTTLLDHRFMVQIETNGTLWVPELPVEHEYFSIVCSPKTGKINELLAPHIMAFKYILDADSVDPGDGLPLFALGHSANPRVARPPESIGPLEDLGSIIYVQPIDTGNLLENTRHIQAAIDTCMEHNYTLCLQTQKIIGLE